MKVARFAAGPHENARKCRGRPKISNDLVWPDREKNMMHLKLGLDTDREFKVLCIGAHSDDIEIGCGGTILRIAEEYPNCEFYWVVLNALEIREAEARRAAQLFAGPRLKCQFLKTFRDGYMPYLGGEVKGVFESELKSISPDLIFTHNGSDAHQDHRLVSQLTWNTFRDHFILEYEIPKYDGDLGRPSVFVPLEREVCESKVEHLMDAFKSQQDKKWFQSDTFFSIMRLRGMECASPSGYAEAFYSRKLVL
jgi:LmbE family N-acetylglucosaminyl deacetylase